MEQPCPKPHAQRLAERGLEPELCLSPTGLSHALVLLLSIPTTAQGLEIALVPVPSPRAGHQDLEGRPPATQTCLPRRLTAKSGQRNCRGELSTETNPFTKTVFYTLHVLSGLSYKGLSKV